MLSTKWKRSVEPSKRQSIVTRITGKRTVNCIFHNFRTFLIAWSNYGPALILESSTTRRQSTPSDSSRFFGITSFWLETVIKSNQLCNRQHCISWHISCVLFTTTTGTMIVFIHQSTPCVCESESNSHNESYCKQFLRLFSFTDWINLHNYRPSRFYKENVANFETNEIELKFN